MSENTVDFNSVFFFFRLWTVIKIFSLFLWYLYIVSQRLTIKGQWLTGRACAWRAGFEPCLPLASFAFHFFFGFFFFNYNFFPIFISFDFLFIYLFWRQFFFYICFWFFGWFFLLKLLIFFSLIEFFFNSVLTILTLKKKVQAEGHIYNCARTTSPVRSAATCFFNIF